MPFRRSDWHEYIMDVWREHRSTRAAVDRLKAALVENPELLRDDPDARKSLKKADKHLEGTYLVRLFAAFEAALRSYDRVVKGDPHRTTDASTLIDQMGGKKGHGILTGVRQGAHEVRRLRNRWTHDSDLEPGPELSIDQARARLQRYLSHLPDEWG